jgi:hypothetical protein
VSNKSIAGTKEDYRRGYDDAYYERGYRPNTVQYVDGYERGLYLRRILKPVIKNTGCDCD